MNEEEIIKECEELIKEINSHKDKDFIGRLYYKNRPVEELLKGLLDLYKQTKKELNSLKEIEQLHKEENGKLRVELEQYKLLEANIDKANKIIAENKFDEGLYGLLMQEKEKNKELEEKIESWKFTTKYVEDNYIDKAKVRVKINKLNNSEFIEDVIAIPYLKELLEEK